MPDAKAIFISYAHEDVAAARKIADALRAFGLEVWFDANELRGGDQWDANIRRQIKACGLFLPIVSATTQNRREAYFRLEWKLADDRTHLMAPGTPFIVPVVIDDTPEYEAEVPESFTKAHFTRLTGGEPTPEFVAQVKKLATDPAAKAPVTRSSPSTPATPVAAGAPASAPAKKSAAPLIVGMSIGGVLAALVLFMVLGRSQKTPVVESSTVESAPVAAVTAPAANDRLSIAVLPFANMSDDPSANSFFADGIHEDLLTSLSYIAELKVVSRTSVMQYRDTTKSVKQIAEELGVGTLLEGSVRRFGDQVRVTAQLIDASTDEHIWAQNYDRKLEDIFAIQGELAKAITDALRVALTDEQAQAFADRPTENLEAYELFLKEQELQAREGNTEERQFQSIAMMRKAVELDPSFALAWANLGVLHAQEHFWARDRTEERRELATAAIEKAIKLAPEDLDVMTYVGSYFYYGFRNYAKAAEFYQKVLDVAPNHVDAIASMGFIRRREGKWAESLRLHERALALDPRNISVITGLIETYTRCRQWDKAVELQKILVARNPGDINMEGRLANFQAERDNSFQPYHDLIARYPDLAKSDHAVFYNLRMQQASLDRDWDSFIELHRDAPDAVQSENGFKFSLAMVLRIADQENEAIAVLREINSAAAQAVEAGNDTQYFPLAFSHALLGEVEASRRATNHYQDYLQSQKDALDAPFGIATEMIIDVWSDTPEVAVDKMREYLRQPAPQVVSRYTINRNLWLYPLWDSPELAALADDDKVWEPLFAD